MNKSEHRKTTIEQLKNIPAFERERIESLLFTNLISTEAWNQAETIGITVSNDFEWDTSIIIRSSWEAGKRICSPKCQPETREMDFYEYNDLNELEVVYYDLKEPKAIKNNYIHKDEIDLLIVPGILFDKRGYRIGFGGGYYDRFLTDFNNTTLSLVSEIQLVDEVPYESFDIPVQYIVTEKGLQKTKSN